VAVDRSSRAVPPSPFDVRAIRRRLRWRVRWAATRGGGFGDARAVECATATARGDRPACVPRRTATGTGAPCRRARVCHATRRRGRLANELEEGGGRENEKPVPGRFLSRLTHVTGSIDSRRSRLVDRSRPRFNCTRFDRENARPRWVERGVDRSV